MKLISVDIYNLHGCSHRKYSLGDELVCYIVGPNGAGKSTILDAIQLGILGYIPGYGKRNIDIFKHSKDGNDIQVTLEFLDDTGERKLLSRKFCKRKNSVTASCTQIPENWFDSVFKYVHELENPLYNFNQFMSQSSNTIKKWFLDFLIKHAQSTESINIHDYLISSVEDDVLKPYLQDAIKPIDDILNSKNMKERDQYDVVVYLNSKIKELISTKRVQIESNQSTIQTLVYYDDYTPELSIDQINAQISVISKNIQSFRNCIGYKTRYQSIRNQINDLDDDRYVKYGDITKDPKYAEYDDKLSSYVSSIPNLESSRDKLHSEIIDISAKIAQYESIVQGSGICPYTRSKCEDITNMVDDISTNIIPKLRRKLQTLNQSYQSIQSKISSTNAEINKLVLSISEMKNNYAFLEGIHRQLSELEDKFEYDKDYKSLIGELELQLQDMQSRKTMHEANTRYNELVDRLNKEKYRMEYTLSIYKLWDTCTGVNELQAKFMGSPLQSFANDVNSIISKFFQYPCTCKFIESSKSNSFEFGLQRGSEYIPYDILSSGEKCIYMICMLSTLLMNSSSNLKLLILDDVLDHLDSTSINHVFQTLSNLDDVDIQYVFAGVNSIDNVENIQFIKVLGEENDNFE